MATDLKQLLERKPMKLVSINIDNPEAAVTDEIIQQAETLLGYKKAQQDQRQRRSEWENERCRLSQALSAEGIDPFTKESVNRHKSRVIRRSHIANAEKVVCALILLYVSSVIIWDYRFIPLAIFISGFGLLMAKAGGSNLFTGGEWINRDFESYEDNDDIPTPILHTAIRLKQRLPDAYLYIQEHRRVSYNPDPFLVIELGLCGPKEYLAVWDERGYRCERSTPITKSEAGS